MQMRVEQLEQLQVLRGDKVVKGSALAVKKHTRIDNDGMAADVIIQHHSDLAKGVKLKCL